MSDAPEFARPQRVDTIGDAPHHIDIAANADERAALARRFGLVAIARLDGAFDIGRERGAIIARGRVTATVTQACIATGDPLPATVDETVVLRFIPDAAIEASPDDEIELDAEDCDTIVYTGSAVDLGEAAAETMMLALDPYPRGPDAEAVLRAAGVKREDDAATGPFGALAGLRDKLGG